MLIKLIKLIKLKFEKDHQYTTRILPDDISKCVPPDSIPNSEVKPLSADGSMVRPCKSRTSSGF